MVLLATVEIQYGPISPGHCTLSTLGALGEILLLDMAIETIFDHILSPVGKKIFHHLPFSTEFTVNLDDGLVFFRGES